MSGTIPGRDSNSIAGSRPATSDWAMLVRNTLHQDTAAFRESSVNAVRGLSNCHNCQCERKRRLEPCALAKGANLAGKPQTTGKSQATHLVVSHQRCFPEGVLGCSRLGERQVNRPAG